MAFQITPEGSATAGDFWDAVYYLIVSKRAWDMIHALQEHPAQIEIKVKGNYGGFGLGGSHFRSPSRGRENTEIYWWVYDWTDLGGRGFSNPAMALMHELGHAHQFHIQRRIHWWSNWEAVENDNMETCEKPIARQLALPCRNNYREGLEINNKQKCIDWGKGPERAGV